MGLDISLEVNDEGGFHIDGNISQESWSFVWLPAVVVVADHQSSLQN